MIFQFQKQQFERFFPFYILVNHDLKIAAIGKALNIIFPDTTHKNFTSCFSIPRPATPNVTFELLKQFTEQLVVLTCNNLQKTSLRGQVEYLTETNQVLFVGSPWFGSIEQVIENKLTVNDFAHHDPLIDLLHIIKTNEIANDDLKQLLKTVSKQRKDLKDANKEIHEIALFPTENPDPLIRIDLNGNILRKNPAAEKLKQFVFEEKPYSFEELFRHIAPLVDLSNERWIFEAKSENKDYSFVCKGIKENGYINIYGRNITQSKIDQEELKRLSLIIQETHNAVIVTDAKGRVEWVNRAFYKVTGYTLDEMFGKTPGSILQGPGTDPQTVKYIREQLSAAKPFTTEIYNYKKSGKGYWLRINAQPIFDSKGNITQFFAIEEDITFEREAQDKIKAAASRMSTLITNLNAGILLENENRTIALINQRFCELFNIPANPADLIGSDCSQSAQQSKHLFKNPENFVTTIDKILLEQMLVTGEILELADGRYLERDFVPIWNESIYEGHLWVYTDITEKVSAEIKLNNQREFYEKILDNIPADIAVFDTQQQYLYVNPNGISDYNIRKSVIGKKEESYFKIMNKPLEKMEQRRKLFKEVLKTKKLISWEESSLNDEGEKVYNILNLYPVTNSANKVDLVIGYGVDITDIKNIQQEVLQSEKRYRDVIDNSLAIITTHDMEGKFITINPMVSKTYGYADHEIIGHSIYDFMPKEDVILFHTSYMKKMKHDKNYSGLFRILHKDGTIIHTLFNNFLKEEPGKDPYVIGFAVDITDRVKAEKELEIAKKTTEQLALTKQNFLANMSHEIRTPMNAIIGMANLMRKTKMNDNQEFYLSTIQSAADNLLVIINDILDLSKIEAGKLSIESIGFEPAIIVEHALQVMNHKAEEKGLALTNAIYDHKLSPILIGDPYRLNQVLLNLMSNAIKFTEKGSVDISCKVVVDLPLEQTVCISVKDTGIGMDQEFVKKLFQKFTQEDESVTRKYGGTGLGMNISLELVELMGGLIDVESEKGIGTTVTFTVTFKKGTKDQLPVKEVVITNTEILVGKKILVTDDNDMNRLVAATILKEYGAEIGEAENGEKAIEQLQQHKYDIVLMDVQMPVMDGLAATQYIREHISKEIPVIALTAFALKGDEEKFLSAGMNDYLSKPFEETQLINLIARCLGIAQLQTKSVTKKEEKKADTENLYDLGKLESIARGNESFLTEIIELFIEQAEMAIVEIQEAFKLGDFDKVKRIAHRIKPSIENMDIVILKKELKEIETTDWNADSIDHLYTLLKFLEEKIIDVIKQLKGR